MRLPRRAIAFGGLALLGAVIAYAAATSKPEASAPPVSDAFAASSTPSTPGVSYMDGSPGKLLADYVDADLRGERLEKASWAKFQAQVLWKAEPTWSEAYVVRTADVKLGAVTAAKAEATVAYDTLGVLALDTFTYETSPSRQRVPFELISGADGWKIGVPMLRPHPGPEATIAFLARMRVHFTRQAAAIDASIAKIRKDAAK